ncbi:MAG: hypothetical protein R3245_09960 [Kiloniellales bacterium]|nr:hypothetical protein [Kiloniellales bacterium]
MHAVFGWFDSFGDARTAVNSLKKEGFSERSISVRDFDPILQENGDDIPEEESSRIMVAVQADGKAAAKAWSVLQDVRERVAQGN